MSFNQIKNKVVPPAKKTAQAVEQWVAALPDIPMWAPIAATIPLVILEGQLNMAMQNPKPLLMGAAAATAAAAVLGPAGGAALIAAALAASTVIMTYALLAVVCCVVLAMFCVYNNRVTLAKSMVVILEAL